jgi:hypothetical protein
MKQGRYAESLTRATVPQSVHSQAELLFALESTRHLSARFGLKFYSLVRKTSVLVQPLVPRGLYMYVESQIVSRNQKKQKPRFRLESIRRMCDVSSAGFLHRLR